MVHKILTKVQKTRKMYSLSLWHCRRVALIFRWSESVVRIVTAFGTRGDLWQVLDHRFHISIMFLKSLSCRIFLWAD